LKVAFSCYIYDFHKEYCKNIIKEVKRRGGTVILSEKNKKYNVDFTIQPDEAYPCQGGRGIWINHAMPVIPQNNFYFSEKFKNKLKNNSSYIFTFSEVWAEWHKMYGMPVYVSGFPKLDNIFGNLKKDGSVLFAPTHYLKKDVYSCDNFNIKKIKELCIDIGYKDFIFRGHPAFNKYDTSIEDVYKKVSLIISDYSSVGLESIILNIPVILLGNKKWINVNSDSISTKAEKAAIRVYNFKELEEALIKYKKDSKYLEKERLKYSDILCKYKGNAAKKLLILWRVYYE
jgi:hypothetical protein